MQITLELNKPQDLEVLLPLLKRLDISVVSNPIQSKDKPPLSKFWGSIPDLDAEKFEEYLKESRKEWDRPIL